MVSFPATRSTHPGFESWPGASPQSGQRGGRSLCEYSTNKLKLGPGWHKLKKNIVTMDETMVSLHTPETKKQPKDGSIGDVSMPSGANSW